MSIYKADWAPDAFSVYGSDIPQTTVGHLDPTYHSTSKYSFLFPLCFFSILRDKSTAETPEGKEYVLIPHPISQTTHTAQKRPPVACTLLVASNLRWPVVGRWSLATHACHRPTEDAVELELRLAVLPGAGPILEWDRVVPWNPEACLSICSRSSILSGRFDSSSKHRLASM